MNTKILLPTLFILLSIACGKKQSGITNDTAVSTNHESVLSQDTTLSDEKIDELLENAIKSIDDSTSEQFQNREKMKLRGQAVIDSIHIFIDNKQYVNALDLYNRNNAEILVYLGTSTQNFGFHREIVRPLLFETLPKDSAVNVYCSILELDFAMTEGVISMSGGKKIPEHYADLLNDLSMAYSLQKNWNKTMELRNKLADFIEKQKGANSQDYAGVIRMQSEMYYVMGETAKAIDLMLKARHIYGRNENTERVNYCNKKLEQWSE